MDELDISEVAARSGLAASTLRFYESSGLIASTGRKGLRRLFKVEVLDRLALIALGRAAGFSLQDIASLLPLHARPAIDRQRLHEQADRLDRRIQRLSAMRDGLRHAAACRAADHLQCPKFKRLLALAAAGAFAREERDAPPA